MVSVLDIFVPPKCHFIVTPSCVVQSNVPSSQAGGSLRWKHWHGWCCEQTSNKSVSFPKTESR